jgi:eukaryotic-like serine/threonine-protein kinase
VLSPDGHMIAFIRGPETFVTPGEIYVKILPDGEPVQLTHDGLPKMAPAFSPDGSRIAYTATDRSFGWNTWVVPVLGGEPRELLPNAAALTWVNGQQVMFSEIKTGALMGIATATESRAGESDIYVPRGWGMDDIYVPRGWGMAHRSWLSPDGKWVLVSEMDGKGWSPCRVIPFDGSTKGELVGPKPARCTYAGWSPDGATMYFSADAGDGYHIWRQHFPSGAPEQLTFGATEEEGIAVSPDGRALVTSAGIRESTVWLHDARGDRQISGEGFATVPGLGMGSEKVCSIFSQDGKKLYYVARKEGSRSWVSGELWAAELDSGRSELVLPGISINAVYTISSDGKHVVFRANDEKGESPAWIAPLDHSSPPERFTGPMAHGPSYESARVSPHGEWKLSGVPTIAQPVKGGAPVSICDFCSAGWDPEGKYFYLRLRDVGEQGGGKTLTFELPPGKDLPVLPPSGLKSAEDAKGLKVAGEIDMTGKSIFAPGPDPSVYAFTRLTVQRNLYRIPLQ